MDVQLVKQQGLRLKNMKYEPKAELAPMRGLRPSGPEKEEGRIILTDQDCQHQQDCEQSNQQEDILEDEGNPPTTENQALTFSYSCAAGCGAVTQYTQKPVRMNSGQWPKACGQLVRIGLGQCQLCGRKLNACKCGETRGPRAIQTRPPPGCGISVPAFLS